MGGFNISKGVSAFPCIIMNEILVRMFAFFVPLLFKEVFLKKYFFPV